MTEIVISGRSRPSAGRRSRSPRQRSPIFRAALCRPPNDSGRFGFHGSRSMRQVCSWLGSVENERGRGQLEEGLPAEKPEPFSKFGAEPRGQHRLGGCRDDPDLDRRGFSRVLPDQNDAATWFGVPPRLHCLEHALARARVEVHPEEDARVHVQHHGAQVTVEAVIGLLSRHAARAPRGRGLRTCPWARLVIRVFGVRLHSPVRGARGDQQEAGTSAQRHGRGRQTAA
jgi:hypothetical protein